MHHSRCWPQHQLLILLCAASLYLWPAVAGANKAVSHQIFGSDGRVLGFTQHSTQKLPSGGSERRTLRELLLREKNSRTRRLVESTSISRNPQGLVTKIARSYQMARSKSSIMATIDGRQAVIVRTAQGDERRVVLPLPRDLVYDNGARLLSEWNPTTKLDLSFYTLDINAPALNLVTLTQDKQETRSRAKLINRQVWRVTDNKLTFHGQSQLTFDPDGDLQSYRQGSFGGPVSLQPIVHSGSNSELKPSSLISQVLVKSPVRIPSSTRKQHIRYRLAFKATNGFALPQSGEQTVQQDDAGLTLDICANCGPGLAKDANFLSAARQPTFWLQSDHPKIRKVVSAITRSDLSDKQKMQRLSKLASKRIRRLEFTGHISALETLYRRAGDCTESAVLLAALGRAVGIPTQVASGVVYSRERYHGMSHAFMPHAWAMAYVDGEWYSFDSALDGFDSTHIAFTISDGDPGAIAAGHRLAGLVRFKSIAEVRQAP